MKNLVKHPTTWIVLVIAVFTTIAYARLLTTNDKSELPETVCGEWVSKYYRSSFNLYKADTTYYMEMQRKEWGVARTDTYRITMYNGLYQVEIGFPLLLSYDETNDILFLSSGGEYNRKTF